VLEVDGGDDGDAGDGDEIWEARQTCVDSRSGVQEIVGFMALNDVSVMLDLNQSDQQLSPFMTV
jgi:hypothetical protein